MDQTDLGLQLRVMQDSGKLVNSTSMEVQIFIVHWAGLLLELFSPPLCQLNSFCIRKSSFIAMATIVGNPATKKHAAPLCNAERKRKKKKKKQKNAPETLTQIQRCSLCLTRAREILGEWQTHRCDASGCIPNCRPWLVCRMHYYMLVSQHILCIYVHTMHCIYPRTVPRNWLA